jgi:hypothetical protein
MEASSTNNFINTHFNAIINTDEHSKPMTTSFTYKSIRGCKWAGIQLHFNNAVAAFWLNSEEDF